MRISDLVTDESVMVLSDVESEKRKEVKLTAPSEIIASALITLAKKY